MHNILKDEETWEMVITAEDMAGCPEDLVAAARQAAIDRGEIAPVSASFLAHIILVNVNGCQMKARNIWNRPDSDSPKTSEEMAQFLTQLICDGISNPVATSQDT